MSGADRVTLAPMLTVGVTGHRSLPDSERVADQCRMVLERIAGLARAASTLSGRLFDLDAPCLRIVSPLAEGADRVVAEVGLTMGLTLQCPLPFSREEYERDFDTEASRGAFGDLLARAETVFELDGRADRRDQAYAALGKLVVRQSDVLIAIWDGRDSRGLGGTGEVVEYALAAARPVVLIDVDGVQEPVLISGTTARLRRDPLSALDTRLAATLGPVSSAPNEGKAGLSRLAAERLGRAEPSATAEDREVRRDRWPELYQWADRLAGRYAALYRRTFVVNFLLSAVAVTAALLSGVQVRKTGAPLWLEIGCILLIVTLTVLARRGAWHARWVEYRHLAEQLRHLPLLSTLGLALPDWGGPAAARNEDAAHWVNWLAGRAQRAAGLSSTRLTPPALEQIRHGLLAELDGQIAYHERVARHFHHTERRSQSIGVLLFALSGLVCVLHLLQLGGPIAPLIGPARMEGPALTVLAGALPAFGAAMLGIRNVGEFSRLARRSSATLAALSEQRDSLMADAEPPTSVELGARVQAVVASMMSETADWRRLVITRGIELPG